MFSIKYQNRLDSEYNTINSGIDFIRLSILSAIAVISRHEIGNFLQLTREQGQPVNTIAVLYYLHFLREENNKYATRMYYDDLFVKKSIVWLIFHL